MNTSQLPHRAPQKEIKTHALRKATSMPIRQSYELDVPVIPSFRPRPPVPVFSDPPSRTQNSSILHSGDALVGNRAGTPQPAEREGNHSTFGTASSIIDSASEDVEILFSHPFSKIISFTVTINTANSQELKQFRSAADRTIAVGPLSLYRLKPQNVTFIQSGKVIHPVMAKSACWCVEEHVGKGVWGRGRGRGVFVLRIRSDVFWRVELNETGVYGSIERFKKALRSVLAFEVEDCPFTRSDVVIVGGEEVERERERERQGRGRQQGRQGARERRQPKVISTQKPFFKQPDKDFQEGARAYSLGPSRQYPLHYPLFSPNETPTLESFDDILGKSFPEIPSSPPSSPPSITYSGLNNTQLQQAPLKPEKRLQPSRSSPISIPYKTDSSSDSFPSLSSSVATYSTTTSLASSPPGLLSIQKPSSSVPRPRAASSSYPHPWTISPPTATTVTTSASTQTIFASTSHDTESLKHLGTTTPQSSLISAADMVIGKPSKYLIGAMMSLAKSVVGNKGDIVGKGGVIGAHESKEE